MGTSGVGGIPNTRLFGITRLFCPTCVLAPAASAPPADAIAMKLIKNNEEIRSEFLRIGRTKSGLE